MSKAPLDGHNGSKSQRKDGASKVPSVTMNQISEQLWLHYFNRYLLEHGFISEQEWLYMDRKIKEKLPPELR